ncbi:hypothetical protein Patl1_27690 [Pistacia atlantica]|uniref:Uncharacterized protein n=1 Tax=Pistacia atlantica TaxID=434234 RepID=A0ACC1BG28_9ROSI|nr:hypothetical protein Patl1_27690 [Pistacia atlantica]
MSNVLHILRRGPPLWHIVRGVWLPLPLRTAASAAETTVAAAVFIMQFKEKSLTLGAIFIIRKL